MSLTFQGVAWPRYPAYATEHLEVAAHCRFAGRDGYLPAPWTPAINSGAQKTHRISPGNWTVSSHDDLVLSGGGVHYCAGGRDVAAVPIPLVTSAPPMRPLPWEDRTISASFVGAATHPLRLCIPRLDGDHVEISQWQENPGNDAVETCMASLARARFAWCPRGYGVTSYRLYEAMRLGAIPVYVSDRHWLPPMIPWADVAIVATTWEQALAKMRALSCGEREQMHRKLLRLDLSIGAVLDWVERHRGS
jgi:hypothetical protein